MRSSHHTSHHITVNSFLMLTSNTYDVVHADELLGSVLHPVWPCQLRWLDLSHNRQLVLAGDEPELAYLLHAAGRLQGLCLQHTGEHDTKLPLAAT
jgi:hypothetical protein